MSHTRKRNCDVFSKACIHCKAGEIINIGLHGLVSEIKNYMSNKRPHLCCERKQKVQHKLKALRRSEQCQARSMHAGSYHRSVPAIVSARLSCTL